MHDLSHLIPKYGISNLVKLTQFKDIAVTKLFLTIKCSIRNQNPMLDLLDKQILLHYTGREGRNSTLE